MKIDGNRKQDRATELVLTYYAAFNRGDWNGMLELLAEDVVHDLNQGARETGREAFAAFLARMNGSYREQLRDVRGGAGDAGRSTCRRRIRGARRVSAHR
jgi:steroid delta-isomerase-like uncharacterized protein